MNAFINIADTPFYAVTDADGHFEIKGLPAGRYELAAVHEKLGEQTNECHGQAAGDRDRRLQIHGKVVGETRFSGTSNLF